MYGSRSRLISDAGRVDIRNERKGGKTDLTEISTNEFARYLEVLTD